MNRAVEVVVSEGEAVVLLDVKGRPDRRALEDWKQRLEETHRRLDMLAETPPNRARDSTPRSQP